MKLKDKTAIITGASRGLGRSIALMFAKEGAKIVVDYLESDLEPTANKNATEVLKEIKKFSDGIIIQCDVSKEDEVKKMVNETIKKFGKIDILVNNAGIVFDVPFFERTIEQWNKTLNTNLLGCFLCSKYASKNMLENKKGTILNISSTNGINSPNPDSMDYDASKAGIISLTKNFAETLAPNIRVNSIAPGWINTDMNKDLPKEFIKKETQKIFLKRFAEPEDIAKVALFLVSDDSSYLTGTIITADGGYK